MSGGQGQGPDLDEKQRFSNFWGVSRFCHDQWHVGWILTVLTFQGGAIRAIRNFAAGLEVEKLTF